MKKLLSIILALAMILSLASCAVNTGKDDSSGNIIDNVEEKIDEVVDELATVTFSLPKMGDEEPETELTDEEKEAGFISVVVNEDGSSTYTMKKSAWEDYLEDFRTTGLDNILNTSETGYESIYSYEINKDLDVATIYVDYDKYNSGADGFAMINVHLIMTLIQYIKGATNDTVAYTVNVADYQTKEIKDTISMPQ